MGIEEMDKVLFKVNQVARLINSVSGTAELSFPVSYDDKKDAILGLVKTSHEILGEAIVILDGE